MIFWCLDAVINDRKIKGKELAELIEVHPNTISRLRNSSELPHIDGELLDKLCKALDCHLFDLIQFVPERQTSDFADRLEEYSLATGRSKAEIVVQAIETYLEANSMSSLPVSCQQEQKMSSQQADPSIKKWQDDFIEAIESECKRQCKEANVSFQEFMKEIEEYSDEEFFAKISRPNILDALLKDKAKDLKIKFAEYLDEQIQGVWQFRLANQLEVAFEKLKNCESYIHLLNLEWVNRLGSQSGLKKWSELKGREMMTDVALIVSTSQPSNIQNGWSSTATSRTIDAAILGALYLALGPLGLVGAVGVKVWQANNQFEEMKKHLKQSLQDIARERSDLIEQTVQMYFDAYGKKIMQLIDEDFRASSK